METLKYIEAQAAIAAAVAKAQSIGGAFSVAVMDAGRNLVAFARMDGAPLGTIEVAQGKAYSSCSLAMRTADLGPLVQPGGALYGLETSHRQPFVTFGGGVPVRRNGRLVAAVGASGGSIDQDVMIAEAAAAALEEGA